MAGGLRHAVPSAVLEPAAVCGVNNPRAADYGEGGLPTIWCKPSSASLATQWRKHSEKRALRERGLAGSLWHRHLGCLGSAAQPMSRCSTFAGDVLVWQTTYEAWCGEMEKKRCEDTIPAGWGVNGVLEAAHMDEA